MIKMILATDEKGAIGLEGRLPWHSREDMRYFSKTTKDSTMVVGNNTYKASCGFFQNVKDRDVWILSNKPQKSYIGMDRVWFSSISSLLKTAQLFDNSTYWLCGGANVYKQMLPHVSEIHHTLIKGEHEADTYFNMDFLNNGEWKLYSKEVLCDNATVNVWRRV